jgi:hypothetical protein
MPAAIRGSCLCGAVSFEITSKPRSLTYCHCSRCRKQAGVFAAVVMVSRTDFRLLSGAEHIRRYVPEAPWRHVRCFCGACGSPLGEPSEVHDLFPIAASALDDDPGVRPVLHQNVASKPAWYEITDGVKQIPGSYGD